MLLKTVKVLTYLQDHQLGWHHFLHAGRRLKRLACVSFRFTLVPKSHRAPQRGMGGWTLCMQWVWITLSKLSWGNPHLFSSMLALSLSRSAALFLLDNKQTCPLFQQTMYLPRLFIEKTVQKKAAECLCSQDAQKWKEAMENPLNNDTFVTDELTTMASYLTLSAPQDPFYNSTSTLTFYSVNRQ